MGETSTHARLQDLLDADDYATVTLADGSEVEVYGDGMVYLYLNGKDEDATRVVNLYDNEVEI